MCGCCADLNVFSVPQKSWICAVSYVTRDLAVTVHAYSRVPILSSMA
jgi:hypothetical protein